MRILFVTSTRIGDAVLSTGVLSYLLQQYPDARFTIACGAPAAPLFASVPNLDSLIVVRKRRMHLHWILLWAQCVGRRWDIVVDIRASGLSWFLPAGRRIVALGRDDSTHRVEWLGKMLGLEKPPDPRIWTSETDRGEAARLISSNQAVISIGPTANWSGKQWAPERFVELAMRLTGPQGILPNAMIAVYGAPSERAQVDEVLDALPPDRRLNMVGATLPVSYECIRRTSFYVGNDSGLTHIAASTGVPTLSVFGPTNEVNYAPWGPKAAVVRTPESCDEIVNAPGFDYARPGTPMDTLTVDAVEAAAVALWNRVSSVD